jgi:hypothetical protein
MFAGLGPEYDKVTRRVCVTLFNGWKRSPVLCQAMIDAGDVEAMYKDRRLSFHMGP